MSETTSPANILEALNKAKDSPTPFYHEFRMRWNKKAMCVYGFVEGKDDLSFYKGKINDRLPGQWRVDLLVARNRNNVIALYKGFDWTRYPKHQIAFFIDRDLSDFLRESLPDDVNVYITDNYSIENDFVDRETCSRVMTEVCSLYSFEKNLLEDLLDTILDLFDEQLLAFQDSMVTVMAWCIYWMRKGEKVYLDNINMGDMFAVREGRVQMLPFPNERFSTIEEYIHNKAKISYVPGVDITNIEKEFKEQGRHLKFVRGKYVLWFFVEFILSVYTNISKFSKKFTRPPKMHVNLNETNAIILVAPRSRIPESLRSFIEQTYITYIHGRMGTV
ncbi:DUF4435 domain-containing protein [Candidatus Magnetobacterium casense]|uniref:DUF4435 domain-containing protein n=1 Tax=Candidatus Magnetobacterium casense TaxID=1455061 RepID=A0ABS6RUX4_9BACT|nr:DUF4435 domain-containing protein [Candidatus Magnetobacterium casensis]MBV6340427.1 DUF4435 domain-containing protein [Candidatus Magnetobacterium casensis]